MTQPVDMCELYSSYCREEGCKPNTAVLQYIINCGRKYPLEKLLLGNNYLGPRGLRPIIRLVKYCPTMVHLNIDENGADNDTVELLCDVLTTHKGMQTVSLRGNPITTTGGKKLLALAEKNPKITHIDLANTDVFQALLWKICCTTKANRDRMGKDTVQLVLTNVDEKELMTTVSNVNTTMAHRLTDKPVIKQLPSVKRSDASPIEGGGSPHMSSPLGRSASSPRPGRGWGAGQSSCGVKSPLTRRRGRARPPVPPITSRLPEPQRQELQKRYRERAMILREVNSSQASKVANRVREELMLLERSSRNQPVLQLDGSDEPAKPQGVVDGEEDKGEQEVGAGVVGGSSEQVEEKQDDECCRRRSEGCMEEVKPSRGLESHSVDDPSAHAALLYGAPHRVSLRREETTLEAPFISAGGGVTLKPTNPAPGSPTCRSPDHAGKGIVPTGVPITGRKNENEANVYAFMESPGWTTLSDGDKLQYLFNTGCRAYVNQAFDTSYMAWKEAMSIAVSTKERQWMAVLTNNLQRLSYEMLVREGTAHLDEYKLEDADLSFQRALEVARKANNAKWESDMHQTRRNVQVAIFHKTNESALRMFEKAQTIEPRKLTEDDYFVVPGSDVLVRHTEAYVNEWACMLLVKEAVELWAASIRVTERIGGSASYTLQMSVKDSLTTVSCFLAHRCFDTEASRSLSWMSTSRYNYHECIMLIKLWSDMTSSTDFRVNHKLFAAVAAAQIGNLYLATNQLERADVQFSILASLGEELRDILLIAAGHTFKAIFNWQSARYPAAEDHFRQAVVRWASLRDLMKKERLEEHSVGGSAMSFHSISHSTTNIVGASTKTGVGHYHMDGISDAVFSRCNELSRFLLLLPRGYVSMMESMSYNYLVSSLASKYRYSEALEMLECSLVCKYRDMLFDKLNMNFSTQPTFAQVTAAPSLIRSPLIYYLTTRRYEWCTTTCRYNVEEDLLIWIIPQEGDMRFIQISVTREFKVASIDSLVQEVRSSLLVLPLDSLRKTNSAETKTHGNPFGDDQPVDTTDIITELPNKTWEGPLRTLYNIFIEPIATYVRSSDSRFVAKNGVVTIIPSGGLWLVPFNALMSRQGRFAVEDFAFQLAFSATQCRFAALSAKRAQQRYLFQELVFVQREADIASQLLPCLLYPPDAHRSESEGAIVMKVLGKNKREVQQLNNSHMPTEITSSEVLLHDFEKLKEHLPRCRTVHIAASTTSNFRNGEVDEGAICMVGTKGDLQFLRSSEIARMELFAEHVVMSNTNMSVSRVLGTNDDTLCLTRGFLASGVPCVIASQWCTPDMVPAQLFERFYQFQVPFNKRPRRSLTFSNRLGAPPLPPPPQIVLPDRVEADHEHSDNSNSHKALFLTQAIREMLKDDAFRYSPRAWAGYYCIGDGRVVPSQA